ncbi:MAG: hypothetical protein NTY63_03815 [Candidatus Bipolaricaulota bacterium]|nr:hypothetical protein [Candidatus Bipolaricaulota bacterium]
MMRWGGFNQSGEEKVRRLLSGKILYYLFAVAALGLLLGANVKWHGGG